MAKKFFRQPREGSSVKIEIVSKYFSAWSNVIKNWRNDKFLFMDLFAGPGIYEDGTHSIPIKVLQSVMDDEQKRKKFLGIFNEVDDELRSQLKTNIESIEGYNILQNSPVIENIPVDHSLTNYLESIKLVPTLLFIDPWGYKGLSLKLIGSVIKNRGCDCIFFFNYNRVNAALSNPAFEEGWVKEILGEEKTEVIRQVIESKEGFEREKEIMSLVREVLQSYGGLHTFFMRFKQEKSDKTSHFLILTSSNPLAHEIIKDIAFKKATDYIKALDAYEFDPKKSRQLKLWEIANIDDLGHDLLKRFKGEEMKMKEIFYKHHIGTPYVKKHYKQALLKLEVEGKVGVKEPRRKGTIGDDKYVKFKT